MQGRVRALGRQLRRRPIIRLRRLPKAHFLHQRKTAGTAIRAALRPNLRRGSYEIVLHGHNTTLADVPRGEKFFFVTRDPVSRFVSGFYSRQRQGRPRNNIPWTPDEAEAFACFTTANQLAEALASHDGAERAAAEHAMRSIAHTRASYWDTFLDEATFLDRADDLLYVASQESLDDEWPHLVDALGIRRSVSLPTDAVTAHRNPSTVDTALTPLAVDNLRRWYAADFRFLELCDELRAERGAGG
jgi:hypothetical protein